MKNNKSYEKQNINTSENITPKENVENTPEPQNAEALIPKLILTGCDLVNFRSEPAQDAENVIAILKKGTELTFMENTTNTNTTDKTEATWYKAVYVDDGTAILPPTYTENNNNTTENRKELEGWVMAKFATKELLKRD